jgi:hypothetical protein
MTMGWKPWNDLTDGTSDAPEANYGVSGYAFKKTNSQHVVYQGRSSGGSGDGYIHELWSDAPLGGTWHHHNLTADATGDPLLASDLPYLVPWGYTFEQQGTQHVLYHANDGDIHELWWDYEDEEWHHHNLTADLPSAAKMFSRPFGYEFSGPWGGQQFIVYEGNDHQIRELRWDAHTGRWHPRNLNEASEVAVLAVRPPTAYVFNSQWQQRHVLYVGTDNLVHELYWEPGADWHHGALTNAATAQANGIPTGFTFGAEGRQFVHYRGTDGHIHQVSWDQNAGWRPLDLTANYGGPAALDAPPTGYVFLGELHVQYLGTAATSTSFGGMVSGSIKT